MPEHLKWAASMSNQSGTCLLITAMISSNVISGHCFWMARSLLVVAIASIFHVLLCCLVTDDLIPAIWLVLPKATLRKAQP